MGHVCKEFPYKYLRPFYLKDQYGHDWYCGFSQGNTGYRLGLAWVSVISLSFLIFLSRQNYSNPGFCVRMYSRFLVSALILGWFAALIADSYAISDAELACEDSFENGDCAQSSQYGTTVAVDLICLMPLLLCPFCT